MKNLLCDVKMCQAQIYTSTPSYLLTVPGTLLFVLGIFIQGGFSQVEQGMIFVQHAPTLPSCLNTCCVVMCTSLLPEYQRAGQ